MGHGTVRYLFTNDPEAGGKGILIGLHRFDTNPINANP